MNTQKLQKSKRARVEQTYNNVREDAIEVRIVVKKAFIDTVANLGVRTSLASRFVDQRRTAC